MAMAQYRVMGVDSEDKIMYLTLAGYWDEPKNAGLFTKAQADAWVREINSRNPYLDRNDRVTASRQGAM